jgi:transposase
MANGRSRFNVLGAMNFVTKRVETVTNVAYITSTQVAEALEKLAQNYIKPIKVILDNAAYQRCAFVKETALRLGIELIYLPTYSPNLNLIERVWKLVKSKILSAAYYETFDNFCKNISECVHSLHTKYASEMSTRITQKFHIVDTKNAIN